MLDTATRRKIDSARDILVGKVPDPKAQVEQITTALIYKFMDDMDRLAQEMGGKAKFFTDGFENYSWPKLLSRQLSGQGRLDLYVQAITNMSQNPHIPQLFRDIFKDAFLPYRDPETLSLFLKEIDCFTYDHSENLGNAYEYLLNVVGTSGEAGQFRTPRHIIDFIVAIVDPKKNETVLDPACGTAGFLISAYKHICKHNSSNFKAKKEKAQEKIKGSKTAPETVLQELYHGDLLTPNEKRKLKKNFVGYDITPGMVKLSLVNMYLHQFEDSKIKIYEYDTLTSEKHWGELFDVILANPPFMTPKGGIRPHNRFSIQAKRSEVLFVDYILEHLDLKGRAGIIVPEGIIFKTENAYKKLRQMLLANGLFAVVSLPQGIFAKPGGKGNVKTSILFVDNQLAKKSDEILFLKIDNDGFELGAQRRKIEKNDLPQALQILEAWKQGQKKKSDIALWVGKDKIAESGDYNLTGERYREIKTGKYQKWPLVELGEENYFIIESGGTPDSKNTKYWNGNIAWITLVDLPANNRITTVIKTERSITKLGLKKSSAKLLPVNSILVSSRATIGRIGIAKIPLATNQGFKNIIIKDFSKISPEYLANVLTRKVEEMQRMGTGGTYKEISKANFSKIKIPLPPLEVQKEIVEQIEVKQNAINHAKEVIKNLEKERRYFGQEVGKLKDVEWVELGDIFKKVNDQIDPKRETGNVVYIGLENVESNTGRLVGETETEISKIKSLKNRFKAADILFGKLRPNLNKIWYADKDGICSTDIMVLRKRSANILPSLYSLVFRSEIYKNQVLKGIKGAQLPRVGFEHLSKIKIPLPPPKIQKQLVAQAEKEEEIIAANRRLIGLMEGKIEKVLSAI